MTLGKAGCLAAPAPALLDQLTDAVVAPNGDHLRSHSHRNGKNNHAQVART